MLVINVLTILNISFSNLCNFESKNIKTKLKASNNPPNKSAFIQMATNSHDSRLHRRFPCSTRLMLENKPKKKTSVRKGKTVPFPFFPSIFFYFPLTFLHQNVAMLIVGDATRLHRRCQTVML